MLPYIHSLCRCDVIAANAVVAATSCGEVDESERALALAHSSKRLQHLLAAEAFHRLAIDCRERNTCLELLLSGE